MLALSTRRFGIIPRTSPIYPTLGKDIRRPYFKLMGPDDMYYVGRNAPGGGKVCANITNEDGGGAAGGGAAGGGAAGGGSGIGGGEEGDYKIWQEIRIIHLALNYLTSDTGEIKKSLHVLPQIVADLSVIKEQSNTSASHVNRMLWGLIGIAFFCLRDVTEFVAAKLPEKPKNNNQS